MIIKNEEDFLTYHIRGVIACYKEASPELEKKLFDAYIKKYNEVDYDYFKLKAILGEYIDIEAHEKIIYKTRDEWLKVYESLKASGLVPQGWINAGKEDSCEHGITGTFCDSMGVEHHYAEGPNNKGFYPPLSDEF